MAGAQGITAAYLQTIVAVEAPKDSEIVKDWWEMQINLWFGLSPKFRRDLFAELNLFFVNRWVSS